MGWPGDSKDQRDIAVGDGEICFILPHNKSRIIQLSGRLAPLQPKSFQRTWEKKKGEEGVIHTIKWNESSPMELLSVPKTTDCVYGVFQTGMLDLSNMKQHIHSLHLQLGPTAYLRALPTLVHGGDLSIEAMDGEEGVLDNIPALRDLTLKGELFTMNECVGLGVQRRLSLSKTFTEIEWEEDVKESLSFFQELSLGREETTSLICHGVGVTIHWAHLRSLELRVHDIQQLSKSRLSMFWIRIASTMLNLSVIKLHTSLAADHLAWMCLSFAGGLVKSTVDVAMFIVIPEGSDVLTKLPSLVSSLLPPDRIGYLHTTKTLYDNQPTRNEYKSQYELAMKREQILASVICKDETLVANVKGIVFQCIPYSMSIEISCGKRKLTIHVVTAGNRSISTL